MGGWVENEKCGEKKKKKKKKKKRTALCVAFGRAYVDKRHSIDAKCTMSQEQCSNIIS
jgi:hypothetical protein